MLRDYIDIAALDQRSGYGIEDALIFWSRRVGHPIGSGLADRIVNLLEDPGHLPLDWHFAGVRRDVLTYLAARAGDVRRRLGVLCRDHFPSTENPRLELRRADGGLI